ncbi:MAG: legumain [Muribaculaceae bacterium]|nr:legumain [Muribaculaceae bacterium]
MKRLTDILCLLVLLMLWGCKSDEFADEPDASGEVIEKTVAIVLPDGDGLREHWERTLGLLDANLTRAFKNQDVAISLNFEFYDESAENLEETAEMLGRRDDIYAVIGGLYSSNAATLTASLSRFSKNLFTLATSEELVRAYSSTGYLWAMTETDITQCEVLLAKAANYGAKSVALIARDGDLYGKTFIDWFSFQTRELGLTNSGVFAYGGENLEQEAYSAMKSGADYVICALSEPAEIATVLGRQNAARREGCDPRLLFSDTAYGTDVISMHGKEIEGIEGVAFGADPESGFDVSYRTFFGTNPTTGEAQLYDAAMLLAYGAWMQFLKPHLTLRDALRTIVSGEEINMGSWTGEDMSLVVDALARGAAPYVRGASGPLRFDQKIFTNVLATTYYNFKVYGGRYIILDYNTSDGGNRTDATLAGWNWRASQMQTFDENGPTLSYGPLTGRRAILVATSTGWENYRHQADVLAIYRRLKASGYTDREIILIMEDDIADHPLNPQSGTVRTSPAGPNLYENVEVDFRLSDLNPEELLDMLETGTGDNVFIFWSGHGVPGAMCWNDREAGITGATLRQALLRLRAEGKCRKLLMMVETCYSGGVLEQCEGIPGMLFITAANGEETSKADIFSSDHGVWMTNRFTSTFLTQIAENPDISLRDLYYRLFINTVGSHVMVYNAENYGNLYKTGTGEFF